MTFKRLLGIVGALCAVAVLTGSVGAGAARTPAKLAINLSTKAAVKQYLRSIHVNPRGVVIQRGLRNYAGPSCPGAGWTCTSTSNPVVQVAPDRRQQRLPAAVLELRGRQNHGPSATNTAKCIKTQRIAHRYPDHRKTARPGSPRLANNDERTDAERLSDRSDHPEAKAPTPRCERHIAACVLQTTTIDGSTAVAEEGDAGNRHARCSSSRSRSSRTRTWATTSVKNATA